MEFASQANALSMINPDTGEIDKGYTQQQFLEDSDINTIVRRFGLTGQLPDDYRPPQYGDFTQVTDYQSALEAVRQAEESFMTIPAAIRQEFNNDPQRLLEFVSNSDNREAAITLGLIPTPRPAETPPAPSAPQVATPATSPLK